MKPWTQAINAAADPDRARRCLAALEAAGAAEALAGASPAQAGILAALFSGSEALSALLAAQPQWLKVLDPAALKHPRRKQGLSREAAAWLGPCLERGDYPHALQQLRQFKQRELLRIGARDLARLGDVTEITSELSDLADVCLEGVWQACCRQLAERCGRPYHQDASGRWRPTAGCVVGLGKLGGQELNYSSDVDVIFVYSDEGSVFKEPPDRAKGRQPVLTNHQFFNRLAEAFIAEVSRLAAEGMLYRIDLRLRPEGEAGPLVRSLDSFENYYAQWGQTWERMMLIKARPVAGDAALGEQFLEMIQPFRYPRLVSPGVLHEVAAVKDRLENEVLRAGELERNVKLGRGGIREIEFIVQSQQVLRAGRQPFLQGSQTLAGLAKLAQYEHLSWDDARRLSSAYRFLRNVEHRLQMENNLQTHTLPRARPALERLARLMALPTAQEFAAALKEHTSNVRRIFEKMLRPEAPPAPALGVFPREFAGADPQWKQFLSDHSFRDVDKALRVLREFVQGPGYGHVSSRTSELAFNLLPRLFKMTRAPAARRTASEPAADRLSDPDRVLTRLDGFIAAYGARATLFELWNTNPAIFDLLLLLFDRSEFLAELAIRTPDLVDELVASGRLRLRKPAEDTLRDLRHGLKDPDQHLWLRRYHQAELMRIGLRDILGLAGFEQYLAELSALAAACLQYALEVVMRRRRLKTPPFAIIGLGKLGGAELDYGSDLDIIFVAGPAAKNLPRLAQLALEVIDLLSTRTAQGVVFHTDARLRPDGEKGLLVNTLPAYEAYYRERADLWEIQALSRARHLAGDPALGARFEHLAAALANFKQPSLPLAASKPDWKATIHRMRLRIQKERTPQGQDPLAIKTGRGGLVDAEFIAQTLCLEHGWRQPNTLQALQQARSAGLLPDAGRLIDNYRRLRRVEGILRRWSYEGEAVLPDDPAPFTRVSVRCGFPTPEAFRKAVAEWRQAIRSVYDQVLGSAPES